MVNIGNDWDSLLKDEFEKDYYKRLRSLLALEYKNYVIYPDMYNIFNALKLTAYKDVKVLILGQDPYINPGEAHGLCFSVENEKAPPSLINIFKELKDDVGVSPSTCNLTKWAKEGVLLLNATLTVRSGASNSHKDIGWSTFTDRVIQLLNEREKPIVFMLWGKFAQDKCKFIDETKHLVLRAPHPSPLSAFNGFFGCKHFSKCNEFLIKNGIEPIDWNI